MPYEATGLDSSDFKTKDEQCTAIIPIQSTISREECIRVLEALDDAKAETDLVNGKKPSSSYMKRQVERLAPFWFHNILQDLRLPHDNPAYARAMDQLGKLNGRVLPTEFGQSAESAPLFQIMQYQPEQDATDNPGD
jgi:hypothetical protein